MKCIFCDNKATGNTQPPACGAHEDLMILTEWMASRGEALTPESVAAHVAKARASSPAGWTITPDEVAQMLPAVLEAKVIQVVSN
jgi:hypothetical protein